MFLTSLTHKNQNNSTFSFYNKGKQKKWSDFMKLSSRLRRIAAFSMTVMMLTAILPVSNDTSLLLPSAASADASKDASADASKDASKDAVSSDATTAAAATTQMSTVLTKLNVSNQTMTSITVSWDQVAGVDGYVLQTYNYKTKAWDALATIPVNLSLTSYSYVASDLNAGTTHRFRIFTYQGTPANLSLPVKSIKTGCKPAIPDLTVIKGDRSARLSWSPMKAKGYEIYQRVGTGAYEKIAQLTDGTATSYIASNLTNGVAYSFYVIAYSTYESMDNGVFYSNTLKGDVSSECTITPSAAQKTSSKAALFSKVAEFKASAAYKTYALAKKINTAKCFVTPGVATTNVNGINLDSYVTDGSVCAKRYYFLAAHDKDGVSNSVIYVMKRSNHKYKMTLVLPNKYTVTDLAFDGTNLWMTAGDEIACVRYKTITSKLSTGVDSANLPYMNTYKMTTAPTYMAYYNNMLWVGTYSTKKNYMTGYEISDKTTTKPVLKSTKRMQMLAKVRAIDIDESGYLYTVRSNQVKKGMSGYISEVRTYLPSWTTTAATIKKNTNKKTAKLPAMAIGISHYNTYSYINFSSVKEEECRYPTDRSWAVKLTALRK